MGLSAKRSVVLALLLSALGWAACHDPDDFKAPTDPEHFFIQLSAVGGVDSLPADGLSTVVLVASITPNSTERNVAFTTTAGKLIGGQDGDDNDQTATVLTVGGDATVELRSSQQTTTARVVASVENKPEVAASIEIAFAGADSEEVLRFTRAPASAPADGQTASFFTVEISPRIPEGSRTVAFETTNGSFSDTAEMKTDTVDVGAGTAATVALYSPSAIGRALVGAKIQSTTQDTTIDFVRAFPQVITLEVPNTIVQRDMTVTVTATLLRDVGKVTEGTVVDFRGFTGNPPRCSNVAAGTPLGTFNAVMTSNADGKATGVFAPGATATAGPVTLIAATANGTCGEIAIQVTE